MLVFKWYHLNSLTVLDVSANTALKILEVNENNLLTSLNVKNGNNTNFTHYSSAGTPYLACIIADDVMYSSTIGHIKIMHLHL